MHSYEIVQLYFRRTEAVPYIMLNQPEQHFTFSVIAGWAPVDLYFGVRRFVDHNNWFGLQIWNELLQPFLIIGVVHVAAQSPLFEPDRNFEGIIGMKLHCRPEKN